MRPRPRVILCLLLAGSPVSSPGGNLAPPTADDVLRYLGFDAAARTDMMDDRIISRGYKGSHDKEISIAVAMLVPYSIAKTFEGVKEGKTFRVDDEILAFEDLGPDPQPGSLKNLQYDGKEHAEIRALLHAEPASAFNFGKGDVERLEALRKRFPTRDAERSAECIDEVNAFVRERLWDRLDSYRKKGLDAIAPYVRSATESVDFRKDLHVLSDGAGALLKPHFPEFTRVLEEYPNADREATDHHFFWVKQKVSKRPAFILVHRFILKRPDGALIVDRQFYVSHTYNCQQVMAGCVPDGERTLVFYTNRTSTDQVAGFSSGLKHIIGRNIMKDEIGAWFEWMRGNIGIRTPRR